LRVFAETKFLCKAIYFELFLWHLTVAVPAHIGLQKKSKKAD